MKLPDPATGDAFQRIEIPGALVLARPDAARWVHGVLTGGATLHGGAGLTRGAEALVGRSTVFVIPAQREDGRRSEERWVVRHYVRGGRLVSRLLGDRYLKGGSIRPFHELAASEEARARGIATPAVMAAAVYPGRIFYRADLVTRYLPRSSELVEALFDPRKKGIGGAMERQDALRAAGHLISAMAAAGISHRDLHAGNILLVWDGAAPEPHLLDLDRCEVAPRSVAVSSTPMVARLTRSLRKWERRTGLRLTEKEWSLLRAGAGA